MTFTIQKHVTSLELSKKLKDLGVKQESYFYWSNAMDGMWRLENRQFFAIDRRRDISAFLASELGEMLPDIETIVEKRGYSWIVYQYPAGIDNGGYRHLEEEKTLQDAMAKMLIYLLENKFISLDDIQK